MKLLLELMDQGSYQAASPHGLIPPPRHTEIPRLPKGHKSTARKLVSQGHRQAITALPTPAIGVLNAT